MDVRTLQVWRYTYDVEMCDGSGRPVITVGIAPMHFAGAVAALVLRVLPVEFNRPAGFEAGCPICPLPELAHGFRIPALPTFP